MHSSWLVRHWLYINVHVYSTILIYKRLRVCIYLSVFLTNVIINIYTMTSTIRRFNPVEYCLSSTDAITIIFVHNETDVAHPARKFPPKLTHQIFINEQIYGYQNLRINIFIAAHSGHMYVNIAYDNMLDYPDKILRPLKRWFPNNLLTDSTEFLNLINVDEPDYIYGEEIAFFWLENELNIETQYRVISCDISSEAFKTFHKRFRSLIIFLIDAASFIDLDDSNWQIIYLYEECLVNGKRRFCPVGFCTIYMFKDTTTTTARISQFFIAPFLQRRGLGYKLLSIVYNYIKCSTIHLQAITVESPNVIFTRMRDNFDAALLFEEPFFKKDQLFKGFSDDMLAVARLKYSLSNEQSKKVYQILRCHWAQYNVAEYEGFIHDIEMHCKAQKMRALSNTNLTAELICDESLLEDPIEANALLHDEAQEFIASIQATMQYLEKRFGRPT